MEIILHLQTVDNVKMWQEFISIPVITISICIIVVALTLYMETRKSLNDASNPWALNTKCTVEDAAAMNNLHPIIFNNNARVGAPYTAQQVFSEIGQLNYRPDSSTKIWLDRNLGLCTTPNHANCFETTEMKATLYTRDGQYKLWTLTDAKRRELINQYGFGHQFKASAEPAPS